MKDYSVIHTRRPRVDARTKATGGARYADDLSLRIDGSAHKTGLFLRQSLTEIFRAPGDGVLVGSFEGNFGQAIQ